MRVLTCVYPGKFEFSDQPVPVPGKGELLLKISKVGVCGTDLHAFAGDQPYFEYPRILGHEIAAEIADPNGHGNYIVGEKVAVLPYFNCGTCGACLAGKTNCCAKLKVAGVHVDGAMREFFAVPAANVIGNTYLTDEQLALVEPFSIGQHAINRADLQSGNKVLILGAGPIGIALAQLAIYKGCNVTIADRNKFRINHCQAIPGLLSILLESDRSLDPILDISNGEGMNTVFDATGNLQAIESGIKFLSHGGTIVLVGLQKQNFSFSHPVFHKKETTLMSSRNATMKDFNEVIAFLRNDSAEIKQYITHRIIFNDAAERFPELADPSSGTIKALIEF